MPDSDENLPLSSNDSQSTENRMRRALGLQGPSRQAPQQRADQARPRHRFVQDGGVPVVVLNSRSDNDPTAPFKARVSELDAFLETERVAHGATRRALHEAQASVQALQTRLAHAEFAHGEALAHLALEPVPVAAFSATSPPLATSAKLKSGTRKVPRTPRVSRTPEPQPVKWWLPGFREKTR